LSLTFIPAFFPVLSRSVPVHACACMKENFGCGKKRKKRSILILKKNIPLIS